MKKVKKKINKNTVKNILCTFAILWIVFFTLVTLIVLIFETTMQIVSMSSTIDPFFVGVLITIFSVLVLFVCGEIRG